MIEKITDGHINLTDRATRILDCIQKAMGKMVAGRNSADILREFGQAI